MSNERHPLVNRLADSILFRHLFFIYCRLYFIYKRITDRKKIRILKRITNPGMTVLDIGANIGYYAILFSKLVGEKGKTHAFEPDSQNFAYLKFNTRKYRNIIVNDCAVGEEDKKMLLYHSDEVNVDHQTYDSGENRRTTEVKCIAIDSYFKNKETVDMVKIDIQGYEYYALMGMRKTIERSKNVVIFGEFWPYGLKKSGADPGDFIRFLKEMGFKVKMEGPNQDYSSKINDKWFETDFFAIKNDKK